MSLLNFGWEKIQAFQTGNLSFKIAAVFMDLIDKIGLCGLLNLCWAGPKFGKRFHFKKVSTFWPKSGQIWRVDHLKTGLATNLAVLAIV